jgi:hypothetical protein
LLADEDYETQRPRLLAALPAGGEACRFLGVFAGERNARVREHAVRLLADAGCAELAPYRPFLDDRNPWVAEAVLNAVERHRIGAGVPHLIDRLEDGRGIVDGGRTWTIGDTAHRVLRAVTCQSFHYDPRAGEPSRAEALRLFREWYAAAAAAPRDAWVREGIARARDYIERPGSPWRLEGLRLLALIGEPALPSLRDALRRAPEDLEAGVVCRSDEPPRVTDTLTCVLVVQNAANRRIALAADPGGPRVALAPAFPPAPSRAPAPGGGRGGARPAPDAPPGAAQREPAARAPVAPAALAGAIIDLAPGEILERAFSAGPVPAAGRYEVRAALADLAADLLRLPPIEGRAILRFEQ